MMTGWWAMITLSSLTAAMGCGQTHMISTTSKLIAESTIVMRPMVRNVMDGVRTMTTGAVSMVCITTTCTWDRGILVNLLMPVIIVNGPFTHYLVASPSLSGLKQSKLGIWIFMIALKEPSYGQLITI